MKKIFKKAIVAAVLMIIVAVLTLCFASCSKQELRTLEDDLEEAAQVQQSFSIEQSVSQGIYHGERGILEVLRNKNRLVSLTLANDNGKNVTSYVYSDNHMDIKNNGTNSSTVIIDSNGLPLSYSNQTLSGQLYFSFSIFGELKQIHLSKGRMTEIYLEYSYDAQEEESEALRWASYYPDVINTLSGCDGLGELIATIGITRANKRVGRITVTKLHQDTKYLGEIMIIKEEKDRIKLESRSITTNSTYGTANQWIDKNVDAEKWYRALPALKKK